MKKIIIKNNSLSVEISELGDAYAGSRFDWTGFVTQITLDGEVTYCVPEQYEVGRGSGGIGFCNEFGIDEPIGFDEVQVGQGFPKIGVGMLKKDSTKAYDFFHPYDIEHAEVIITKSEDRCQFLSRMTKANGYESVLTKVVKVEENRLIISYRLENNGTKQIKTNEYCHNFIGINESKVGKDYQLTIPNLKSCEVKAGNLVIEGENMSWTQTPKEDFYALIKTSNKNEGYNWQLFNQQHGAGVRDLSTMNYGKFAIWGYTHVISPELFIEIQIDPGKSMDWERVYEFYKDK